MVQFLLAHGCSQESRRASQGGMLDTTSLEENGKGLLPEQGSGPSQIYLSARDCLDSSGELRIPAR
jgi:hypothetical protein